MTKSESKYLFDVREKPSLDVVRVPLVRATEQSLKKFGCLVNNPDLFDVEIVTWPASGWRPIDEHTGNEGGSVQGIFECTWQGDILMGRNDAVNGHYVLGWSCDPQEASKDQQTAERNQILLWHMNYHPDGGQLFYPLEPKPFVVPVAPPGDDFDPTEVIAYWCDGSQGLYIHPNVWHEGVFPTQATQSFGDKQGRVHARILATYNARDATIATTPRQGNGLGTGAGPVANSDIHA